MQMLVVPNPFFHAIVAMHSYVAYLGHHPALSLAELHVCIPDMKVTRMLGTSMAFFDSEAELSQKNLETWGDTFIIAWKKPPRGTGRRVAFGRAGSRSILSRQTDIASADSLLLPFYVPFFASFVKAIDTSFSPA